jgi:hypothetical protein
MPLHRAVKGDSPLVALSLLIRRIERGGGKVQQILEGDDGGEPMWLVQSSEPRGNTASGFVVRDDEAAA